MEPITIERRRRGRPPLRAGERTVSMTVSIPESLYDRLTQRASAHRIELAPYVRFVLENDDFSNEKSTARIA